MSLAALSVAVDNSARLCKSAFSRYSSSGSSANKLLVRDNGG